MRCVPLVDRLGGPARRPAKSEIRRPKAERRPKPEIRNPNGAWCRPVPNAFGAGCSRPGTAFASAFGLRISDFLRSSDFGLRISASEAASC